MASGRKLDLISGWSPSVSVILILYTSLVIHGLKTELDDKCRELRLREDGNQLTKIQADGACSLFAYCVGSKAELAMCPKGLQFNPETQDCDIPEKVKCEKSTEVEEPCSPQHCGIQEDAQTCSKFSICADGKNIWNYQCPANTLFDSSGLACVPKGKATCPPAPGLQPPFSEGDGEAKKTKSGEYDILCSKFWKGSVNKVPHPKDCARFFYCFDGRAKIAACPLGLLYNVSSGHCDYVDNVTPCGTINMALWGLAGGKECVSRPCGIYPSSDCDSYTVCDGGQAQLRKCNKGYNFDTETGICQPTEEAVCWDQPSPAQTQGFDRTVGVSKHSHNEICPFHNRPASKAAETHNTGVILISKSDLDLGDWAAWKDCPAGRYVNGLQSFRRVMMSEDAEIVDHAGLTTIAFSCNTPEEFPDEKHDIIDEVAPNLKRRPLDKMNFFKCDIGPAVGFQLNQVMNQGPGDDLATDWVKLICACGKDAIKPYDKAEFREVSGTRGIWTEARVCGARQALCGLSAQLHPWVENKNIDEYDNTGINGVKMRCCDVPSPAIKYQPSESQLFVTTLENFDVAPSQSFQVQLLVGLLYNRTGQWKKAINFYEGIGYSLYSLSHPFQKHFSENMDCLADSSCIFNWGSQRDNNEEAGMWGLAAASNITINVKKGTRVTVNQVVATAGPYIIGTFGVQEVVTELLSQPPGDAAVAAVAAAAPKEEAAPDGRVMNPGPIVTHTFDAGACPFMPREEETTRFSTEVDGFIIASKPRKDVVSEGTWMEEDECGPGKYVVAIASHRTQIKGKLKNQVDYAGLTSIAFKCESPGLRDSDYLDFVAPGLTAWPSWNNSRWMACDEGAAIGFEINAKQEVTKAEPDDFATDNIKLHCSCGPSVIDPFDDPSLDEGLRGIAKGAWRKGRYCSKRHAICGLQTQMHTVQEEYDPKYDNTGLNEIRVKCCEVPDPLQKFQMKESRQLLVSLKPDPKKGMVPDSLLIPIGLQMNNSKVSTRRMNFYESIGYPIADMKAKLKEKIKLLGKECQPQCMYHWDQLQPQILQDLETHEESVVVPTVGVGDVVEYYQVVAQIGFFLVRTNKYIIVTDDGKKRKEIAVTIPFEHDTRQRKGSAWNSVKSLKNSGEDVAENKAANKDKPSPGIQGRTMEVKFAEMNIDDKREPVAEGNANESECKYHNLPSSESHEMTDKGIILPSPKLLDNGEWKKWQYCPTSQYVVGLTAYREILETGDGGVDKVGLTALGFICQNPADENVGRKDRGLALATAGKNNSTQLLFSTDDIKYLWKRWYFCRPGYVGIGFQTLGLPPVTGGDNIGTQNVKMFCSSGKEQSKPYDDSFFAGGKGVAASWGEKKVCKRGQALCGGQVQIHKLVREANDLKEYDNTGVNSINLKCCDVPFPDTLESFYPEERRVLIMDVDRLEDDKTFREYYNVTLHVGTEMGKTNLNCFYTSIGYDMSNIKAKFERHVTAEGAVPCKVKRCDINWQGLKPGCFEVPRAMNSKHKVIGGQRVKTYQVVADAGPFLVKTNQYVQHIINKEVSDGPSGREVDSWNVKNKWVLFEMPLANTSSSALKLKVFDEISAKRYDGKTECGDRSVVPIKDDGKKKGFYDLISSPRITDNGEWQEWIQCPKGSFVSGLQAFRRVVMEGAEDQLGLTSVGFVCTTPSGEITKKFGFVTQNLQARNWTAYNFVSCQSGYATGFQLNVMKDMGKEADDIATDNIKLFCSCSDPVLIPFNNSESRQFPGPGRGKWSERQNCPPQTIVCAVRLQSEPYEDLGVVDLNQFDNTAINNVEMRCCRPPPLMESCNGTEKKVLVGSCDNTHNENPGTCEFVSGVGYLVKSSPEDKVLKVFGSLGVDIEEEVAKFGKKLMPCTGPDCLYAWDTAPTEVWSKLTEEPRVIKIRGNAKVDLYQVIGECSFVQIRSNRYIINRNKFGNKTTEVWDVGGDQVTIQGRSMFGGGPESISCPFHNKPAATYVSDSDVKANEKVIAVSSTTTTTSSFFAVSIFMWINCPDGYYIIGIKDHGKIYVCMNPLTGDTISMGTGDKTSNHTDVCDYGGVAVGLQLKDPNGGYNLLCSFGRPVSNTKEPTREDVEEGQYCGKHMAICGMSDMTDDASSLKVKCCPVASPVTNCEPSETRILLKTCKNSNTIAEKCDLNVGIGVNLRNTADYKNQTCFHSGVGYDDVQNNIPILKQKLEGYYTNASCQHCLYPWDNNKAVLWIKVSIGSHEITMNPRETAKVYQIIGTCGNLQVKTDGIVKVIEGASTSNEPVEQLVFV